MYVSVRDAAAKSLEKGLGDDKSLLDVLNHLSLKDIELRYFQDDTVRFLESGGMANLMDSQDSALFKGQINKNGIGIPAFLMSNNFSDPDRPAQIDWILRCADAAERLGVPTVRINSSVAEFDEGLTAPDVADISSSILSEVLRQVPDDSGVSFGIENHGQYGNDPVYIRRVLKSVGDGRLGLTLDSGNFYWFGFPIEEVYAIFEEFGPFAKHVHVKNIKYPEDLRNKKRDAGYKYSEYVSPIYEGDIDHAKFVESLRKNGYKGSLCIEDESLGKFSDMEKLEVLKKDVEYLKKLVQA